MGKTRINHWIVPAISVSLLSQSALAMGKNPQEQLQIQNDEATITQNQLTINTIRAELGLPVEAAPALPKNPSTDDLSDLIIAQSNEMSDLETKYQAAKAASDAEATADTTSASNLKKNPYIDPAQWQESRCRGLGDSLPNVEVAGRKAWGLNCLGQYAAEVTSQANQYTKDHGHIINPGLQELADNLNMEVAIINNQGGQPWGTQGQAFYPTFGTVDDNGVPQNSLGLVAPVSYNNQNDCKTALRSSGGDGGPILSPTLATDLFNDHHYQLVALCVSGCYTPDQQLLFKNGYEEIGEAFQNKQMEIQTVSPDSTLDHLDFETTELQAYTVDIAPSWQNVFDIRTLSGKKITVTTNHALLDSSGQMRSADTLKPGDMLVQADGTPDPIVDIQERAYYGKVYNVHPKSGNLLENIVVANGLLSGSVYYQNAGVKDLNRDLFRIHLPDRLVQ